MRRPFGSFCLDGFEQLLLLMCQQIIYLLVYLINNGANLWEGVAQHFVQIRFMCFEYLMDLLLLIGRKIQ